MSARREHRLRHLERKVDELGRKADFLSMRVDHNEIRIFEMQRIQAAIRLPEDKVEDTAWTPTQARPQKGLLQRIMDFFGGK